MARDDDTINLRLEAEGLNIPKQLVDAFEKFSKTVDSLTQITIKSNQAGQIMSATLKGIKGGISEVTAETARMEHVDKQHLLTTKEVIKVNIEKLAQVKAQAKAIREQKAALEELAKEVARQTSKGPLARDPQGRMLSRQKTVAGAIEEATQRTESELIIPGGIKAATVKLEQLRITKEASGVLKEYAGRWKETAREAQRAGKDIELTISKVKYFSQKTRPIFGTPEVFSNVERLRRIRQELAVEQQHATNLKNIEFRKLEAIAAARTTMRVKEATSRLREIREGERGIEKEGFGGFGQGLGSAFGLPLGGIAAGAAAGYAFLKLAKDAMEWEKTIARIRGQSQLAQLSTTQWTDEIHNLAKAFGVARTEIASGLAQVLRSGVAQGSAAIDVTRQAQRLAQITGVDSQEAAESLTTVMRGYGLAANQAEKTAGILFHATQQTNIPLNQLSQTFGNLTAMTSQLGVSLEEIIGVVGLLKETGMPTWMTMALIGNVITGIISQNPLLVNMFRQWGYQTGEQAIRAKGLVGVLKMMSEEINHSGSELAKAFPGAWNLQGAFAVVKEKGLGAEEAVSKLTDSLKRFKDASNELEQTGAKGIERTLETIKTKGQEAASGLFDLITDLVKFLVDSEEKSPFRLKNGEEDSSASIMSVLAIARRGDDAQRKQIEDQKKRREDEARAFFEEIAQRNKSEEEYTRKNKARHELELENAKSAFEYKISNLAQYLEEKAKVEKESIQESQRRESEALKTSNDEARRALTDRFNFVKEELSRKKEDRNFGFSLSDIFSEATEIEQRGSFELARLNPLVKRSMETRLHFLNPPGSNLEDLFRKQRAGTLSGQLTRSLGLGDFNQAKREVAELGKLVQDEINQRLAAAKQLDPGSMRGRQNRELLKTLFEYSVSLKLKEADIEKARRQQELNERRAERNIEAQERRALFLLEQEHRKQEFEKEAQLKKDLLKHEIDARRKQEETSGRVKTVKDELALLQKLRYEDFARPGGRQEFKTTLDEQVAAIRKGTLGIDPEQMKSLNEIIDRYVAGINRFADKFFKDEELKRAISQFTAETNPKKKAILQAQIDTLTGKNIPSKKIMTDVEIGAMFKEVISSPKNIVSKELSDREIIREALLDETVAIQNNQLTIQKSMNNWLERIHSLWSTGTSRLHEAGIPGYASGGYIHNTGPAYLHSGEFVINPKAVQGFIPQLVAINNLGNRGVTPSSTVNNTGDFNININESKTPQATAREVAVAIQREVRRGTVRRF